MSTQRNEFEPLPSGDYLVRMTSKGLQEKPTKNNGKMISAGFEVVNGDAKGRLVFHNFLVEHSNPKAAEIGNKQLDEYLQAVGAGGLKGINDDRTLLEQWTELPFIAVVGIEEGGKEYTAKDGSTRVSKPRNNIKKFMSR